jgi:hypothetical protein
MLGGKSTVSVRSRIFVAEKREEVATSVEVIAWPVERPGARTACCADDTSTRTHDLAGAWAEAAPARRLDETATRAMRSFMAASSRHRQGDGVENAGGRADVVQVVDRVAGRAAWLPSTVLSS